MFSEVDIARIMGDVNQTERKIMSVMNTCKNAKSDWAKNYWFGVWSKLCKKYNREDLYRKHLHQGGYYEHILFT